MGDTRPKFSPGRIFVFVLLTSLLLFTVLQAQDEVVPDSGVVTYVVDSHVVVIAPVTSLIASEYVYDDGEALELSWVPSIDDQLVDGKVLRYELYCSVNGREAELVSKLAPGTNKYTDESLHRDTVYAYHIVAYSENFDTASVLTAGVSPQREWINFAKGSVFLWAFVMSSAVMYFIWTARRRKLFIRKIAGLEAVDEAIGRATEMGRPILFIPGILDMDDVQTLAALTILGRVAHQIAEYDTKIRMPVSRSLVMTAARETIKTAYQSAGHPDAYSDDMVQYVTDEQFGYVAAVDGAMVREKPATVFLLGAFFAESLILAETGNSIGAIQIAGTARPAQLPFFIAACDFTLIGEELFAASAYLSDEPKQLGSLKGQDVGKGIAMAAIVVGVIAATAATAWEIEFFRSVLDGLTAVFTSK